jgi:exodeoxyribonuclease V alpha subunit
MIAGPLAELLIRLNGPHVPELERAISRVCEALDEGHVCVPLGEDEELLRACDVVGAPGDFKPLILDNGFLYLARYWNYENALANCLRSRASSPTAACDENKLAAGIERYLHDTDAAQRNAASNAVRRKFSVITGGPGTGKTRTATVALALLAEQGVTRFALAAPTGKAAARLKDSLAQTLDTLAVPAATRAILPTDASTLHRLLGTVPGSGFRHNAENPLSADVIVVDEASMVDLPLMAKLFDAVRPDARIVLLGDPHQLASVEAGHVLGDICDGAPRECITELVKNHRFPNTSGIYQLSKAINDGDEAATLAVLDSPPADLSAMKTPAPAALAAALQERIVAGFRACISATTPLDALRRLGDFRILCALRAGPHGVVNLNRLAEQSLADACLISPNKTFYAGRPLIVLRNDYSLRLFNGDTGIVLPDERGELRAFFAEDGGVRSIPPSRLPEHETAFAMTVHKAQGSEFDRILLVLPERDSPVLSRELLYTAITRAKTNAKIWWSDPALRAALARRAVRWSGLKARLSKTTS